MENLKAISSFALGIAVVIAQAAVAGIAAGAVAGIAAGAVINHQKGKRHA